MVFVAQWHNVECGNIVDYWDININYQMKYMLRNHYLPWFPLINLKKITRSTPLFWKYYRLETYLCGFCILSSHSIHYLVILTNNKIKKQKINAITPLLHIHTSIGGWLLLIWFGSSKLGHPKKASPTLLSSFSLHQAIVPNFLTRP